jgi:hypothetical protein
MLRVVAFVAVFVALASSAVFFALNMSSDDDASQQTPVEGGSVTLVEGVQTNNGVAPNTEENQSPSTTPEKEFIRIVAVGEMTPYESVHQQAQTENGYNYKPFFADVRNELSGDVVFCNQETPSLSSNPAAGFPNFNAPTAFVRDLSSVGCNLISLANDNVGDQGQAGIDATVNAWQNFDTWAVSGANKNQTDQNKVRYFDISGTKFAFLAFTEQISDISTQTFGVNRFSNELVDSLTAEAAQNADYVIVSAHWGTEDSSEVNESQRNWANRLASNGADLVLGTGPHVMQPVEQITSGDGDITTVFFSLGNFLNTQLNVEQLTSGIAYIDVPIDPTSDVKLSFLPTYMHYDWSEADRAARNLGARTNLQLVPLSEAEQLLAGSGIGSTAQAQIDRISAILTSQNAPITIL